VYRRCRDEVQFGQDAAGADVDSEGGESGFEFWMFSGMVGGMLRASRTISSLLARLTFPAPTVRMASPGLAFFRRNSTDSCIERR